MKKNQITFEDVYKYDNALNVLYGLLEQREQEYKINISYHTLPSRKDHNDFVSSRPYRLWYIVVDDIRILGAINVTKGNEIGLTLFRCYRGEGYGRKILDKFLDENKPLPAITGERPGSFIANINPLNDRSIHLFKGLGFVHIQNTYLLPEND